MQGYVNTLAVVDYVDPVANLAAIAIDGKRLILQCVRDEQGYQFLGILVRSEVVGSSRYYNRQTVSYVVRPGEEFAACLAGRVGAVRLQGICFRERAFLYGAVDFIRRNVHESLNAESLGGLQQDKHPVHVGKHKTPGIVNGAVHVGLSGEVHNRIGLLRQVFNDGLVPDISMEEPEAGVALEICQVVQISRIGERVQHEDVVARILVEHVAAEVAADEASTACDEDAFHSVTFCLRKSPRINTPPSCPEFREEMQLVACQLRYLIDASAAASRRSRHSPGSRCGTFGTLLPTHRVVLILRYFGSRAKRRCRRAL